MWFLRAVRRLTMLRVRMSNLSPTAHPDSPTQPEEGGPHFIEEIIDSDLSAGKHGGRLQTRFPPEPNGFLHIGHAKAIWVNFTMAGKAPLGRCNLRLDDTNPVAEDELFVRAIQDDIRWLGFDFGDRCYFASDYFERLYECAEALIRKGLAYVDSQTPDAIKDTRGNFYKPGIESPFRERSPEENLALLRSMREGKLEEGAAVLRAKIDMAHPNMNMRDPLMYRIRRAHHHRTGDAWCIYPMYDFAHPLSDAFEGVTHSLCSLEFENHRPLYDWFVENVGGFDPVPRQIEFARLNLTYTVMSKRKLQQLVKDGQVRGWDDPRMPTIAGMRRRGYLPESIVGLIERTGVAKKNNLVEVELLEHRIREDLNRAATRTMAVLRPLKVTISNMAPDETYEFEVPIHPEYPEQGSRKVQLGRHIYVEQEDYMEEAPKKWFRLAPGQEVRLRGACFIRAIEAKRGSDGTIEELICTWDPESKGGASPDGRKVKGTIHWIGADSAVRAEVRLYDRLFNVAEPEADENTSFLAHLNPASLEVIQGALVASEVAQSAAGTRYQFERMGYFTVDPDSRPEAPVLNRTITLKDSWSKVADKS
jgi:glutaminyl-tRNA synthetase